MKLISDLLSAKRQRGQGMTEYIVIVALIGVAAITAYQYFGQTMRQQTAGITQELSGQDAQESRNNAVTTANAAVEDAGQLKGLDNYRNPNSQGGGQ